MRLTNVRTAAIAAITATLALAPAAAASPIVLDPPGKAGANQYFETIPSADGNAAPPSGSATGTPAIDRGTPGAAALKQLQKSGADGQAAANFAATSAPSVQRSRDGQSGPPTDLDPAATASAGGSAFSGVFDVLGGSDAGGIGVFMPILLIGGLVSAIVAAGLRRRDDSRPTGSS